MNHLKSVFPRGSAGVFATFSLIAATAVFAGDVEPFEIRVVDSKTGRGVPLVELRTTAQARFYTDNAGRVAFAEPGLMDGSVFFHIGSHGYRYAGNIYGIRGRALDVTPGGRVEIEIDRINLAERLYRITGYGLYRESMLLGHEPPFATPLLNSGVVGQDSVQAAVYNGKIYWFWGDTGHPSSPFGNFRTTGATSPLPENARIPRDVGIELTYFADGDFVRPMTRLPTDAGNLMWISGLVTVTGAGGKERLIAHYDHRAGLGKGIGQGVLLWNDESEEFDILQEIPLEEEWRRPIGQATRWTDGDRTHLLFVRPWANVRVADDLDAVQNRDAYEAFTCLQPGTNFAGAESHVHRDPSGRVVWGWKRNTQPIDQSRERELLDAGLLEESEARFQLRDIETGEPVQVGRSTVNWNPHLGQWIQISTQVLGRSRFGEIWFSQADAPTGPWRWARRIITHDNYSFYNPAHHTFFDEDNGRLIYIEGTYTKGFTDPEAQATPYYDYNQIMYRLDVNEARIAREQDPKQ